jgi:hypothetical protein
MDPTKTIPGRAFALIALPLAILVAIPVAVLLAILFYVMTFFAVVQTLVDSHVQWLPALAPRPKDPLAGRKVAPAVRA